MANEFEPRYTAAPPVRRLRIALACTVCGNRNYKSSKSVSSETQLSLKKFCSNCNQHTVHIEGT